MTIDEAKIIAYAIRTADGGCGFCVQKICDDLNDLITDFHFEIDKNDLTYNEVKVNVTIKDRK